jgi:hypothetical protein
MSSDREKGQSKAQRRVADLSTMPPPKPVAGVLPPGGDQAADRMRALVDMAPSTHAAKLEIARRQTAEAEAKEAQRAKDRRAKSAMAVAVLSGKIARGDGARQRLEEEMADMDPVQRCLAETRLQTGARRQETRGMIYEEHQAGQPCCYEIAKIANNHGSALRHLNVRGNSFFKASTTVMFRALSSKGITLIEDFVGKSDFDATLKMLHVDVEVLFKNGLIAVAFCFCFISSLRRSVHGRLPQQSVSSKPAVLVQDGYVAAL